MTHLAKVQISERLLWLQSVVDNPSNECAIWPWALAENGYATVSFEGTCHNALRAAMIMLTGENLKGMDAAHGPCHNRACCNPHAIHGAGWKTRSENQRDRARDGTLHNRSTPAAISIRNARRRIHRLMAAENRKKKVVGCVA